MSSEHEWPLTVWPTRGEVEQAIATTIEAARLAPPEIYYEAFDEYSADPPRGLPAATPADQLAAETIVTLLFRVPVASAVDTALRLDPLASRDSYERGLEPPRGTIDWDGADRAGYVTRAASSRTLAREGEAAFTSRPDHYTLAVDLVSPDDDDDEPLPARVRIYSNEYDNREAYGIVAVIAADLAERLERLSAFS